MFGAQPLSMASSAAAAPVLQYGQQAHFLKNGEAQITQAVSGLPAQRRLLMSGEEAQGLFCCLGWPLCCDGQCRMKSLILHWQEGHCNSYADHCTCQQL